MGDKSLSSSLAIDPEVELALEDMDVQMSIGQLNLVKETVNELVVRLKKERDASAMTVASTARIVMLQTEQIKTLTADAELPKEYRVVVKETIAKLKNELEVVRDQRDKVCEDGVELEQELACHRIEASDCEDRLKDVIITCLCSLQAWEIYAKEKEQVHGNAPFPYSEGGELKFAVCKDSYFPSHLNRRRLGFEAINALMKTYNPSPKEKSWEELDEAEEAWNDPCDGNCRENDLSCEHCDC